MPFQLKYNPNNGLYDQVEIPDEEEKDLQPDKVDVKLQVNTPVEPVKKAIKGRVK